MVGGGLMLGAGVRVEVTDRAIAGFTVIGIIVGGVKEEAESHPTR